MNKIATHNSITGERCNLLSYLFAPFCKCQSKTLVEQYRAGCRFFDLRIVKDGYDYYGAHGVWRTKNDVATTLYDLYVEALNSNDEVYIMTTYEGALTELEKGDFLSYMSHLESCYPRFTWGSIYAKYEDRGDIKVDWVKIKQGAFTPKTEQGFLPLDGTNWQTYIPIPWLWNLIYTRKHEFSEDVYTFVDFL